MLCEWVSLMIQELNTLVLPGSYSRMSAGLSKDTCGILQSFRLPPAMDAPGEQCAAQPGTNATACRFPLSLLTGKLWKTHVFQSSSLSYSGTWRHLPLALQPQLYHKTFHKLEPFSFTVLKRLCVAAPQRFTLQRDTKKTYFQSYFRVGKG